MPQCGLHMNNVSFLKQWGKKYGIGIIVGLLMSVGFLVMDADRWIGMHTLNQKTAKYTVVIDSGHGGVDPGKIGVDGVYEKDINLAITEKVKKCLEKEKITAELTRKEDKGLGTTGDGSKKTEDMQARVKMINETKPVLTVSIHQNSYEDPEIHGAQVFYYEGSKEGKMLAELLQKSLIDNVDPQNHRVAKANSGYYILKNTSAPTVIVECGFLSNPEEESLLISAAYQEKLVEALQKGICAYLVEH